MKFSIGDVIIMKDNKAYSHTVGGVIGTIVDIESHCGDDMYIVSFTYDPEKNPEFKFRNPFGPSVKWTIHGKYMELLHGPESIEEKVCRKIKELDKRYAEGQLKKGNKVCVTC